MWGLICEPNYLTLRLYHLSKIFGGNHEFLQYSKGQNEERKNNQLLAIQRVMTFNS